MVIKCYINKPQTIKSNPLCVVYDENEKLLSINDVSREIIFDMPKNDNTDVYGTY